MRPVASTGTSRVTRTDMVLGGYLIPRNSFIVVPFDAVHHFPGNWPDQPHAFIPVQIFRLFKKPCYTSTCMRPNGLGNLFAPRRDQHVRSIMRS